MNDMQTTQQQYLTFSVRGDEYAVAILRVKEIIAYDSITRVPRTPAFIRGVINLRGSVVPVIDLAQKFGYAMAEPTRNSCIVIVELQLGDKPIVLGLLVDEVDQVIDLQESEIQPPPSFGTKVAIDFLTGMGRVDGSSTSRSSRGFVLLLDLDRVLAAEDVVAAVEVAEPAA
ncbi:MAG TPA: chemotaxis protein CheW [Thermoanaerobaculia bacterium]|jgi:purine-binding chemotaxis protein CheW